MFRLQVEDAIGQKVQRNGQQTADRVRDNMLFEDLGRHDRDRGKNRHQPGDRTVASLDPPETCGESRQATVQRWEAVVRAVTFVCCEQSVDVPAGTRDQIGGTGYLRLEYDVDAVADSLDGDEGDAECREDLRMEDEEEGCSQLYGTMNCGITGTHRSKAVCKMCTFVVAWLVVAYQVEDQ